MTRSITQTLLEPVPVTHHPVLKQRTSLISSLNVPWHNFFPFLYDLSQLRRRDQQLPRHCPMSCPFSSLKLSKPSDLRYSLEVLPLRPSNRSENRALTVLYFFNSVCQKGKSYSMPYGHEESLVFSLFRDANIPKRSAFLIPMKDSNSTSLMQQALYSHHIRNFLAYLCNF